MQRLNGRSFMRRFDYSFLKDGGVPADLVNLLTGIYSMKTMDETRKNKYSSIYTELEKVAKVQSVKGSNAIEGIVTSDERIRAIVNQSSAPLNHNEQEISGYRDALNLIHTRYEVIPFNENTILDLHKMLLNEAKPEYAGHYKTSDNIIMEV